MSGRREEPDQTPVEWPAHLKRPPTLAEEIQRLVRAEVSRVASESGLETFEEADDFDMDDEMEPFSPHELSELEEEVPRDALTKLEERSRMESERKGGSSHGREAGVSSDDENRASDRKGDGATGAREAKDDSSRGREKGSVGVAKGG